MFNENQKIMKTVKLTPDQFEKLYNTDFDCSLPFFQDEWDEPNEATSINIHENGTLTYDVPGLDGINNGYTWRGISFEELLEMF